MSDANSNNLGVPYLKVELHNGLKCGGTGSTDPKSTGVSGVLRDRYVDYQFDIDARSWDLLLLGGFAPIFCELISDSENNFGAIIPLRRTMMVNNLLIDGTPLPSTVAP